MHTYICMNIHIYTYIYIFNAGSRTNFRTTLHTLNRAISFWRIQSLLNSFWNWEATQEKKCTEVEKCRRVSGDGVGAKGIVAKGENWCESWNQIQTLKECLCCQIYCAYLGAPWCKIVGASRAVSNRESRYPPTSFANGRLHVTDVPTNLVQRILSSWHTRIKFVPHTHTTGFAKGRVHVTDVST